MVFRRNWLASVTLEGQPDRHAAVRRPLTTRGQTAPANPPWPGRRRVQGLTASPLAALPDLPGDARHVAAAALARVDPPASENQDAREEPDDADPRPGMLHHVPPIFTDAYCVSVTHTVPPCFPDTVN